MNLFAPNRRRDWSPCGSAFIALVLLGSIVVLTEAQFNLRPPPFGGLQRSRSDPGLNRNRTNLHRQASFRPRDHCRTNYKFDYVQLTLQWAPGVCSTSPQACKREESKHFTVHGMWPTITGTQEPANCCFDNTFYYKDIEPLLPLLNEHWFSYFDLDGNRHFWAHEWLKHGTCSRDVPSLAGEARYFGTTVQMARDMPILETLAKANIVPSNDQVYNSGAIVAALAPISKGKIIQIDCDYEHHQPTPIVTGLNFCFDASLKPADCPDMKRKCQRQLIFPASASRFFSRN